VNDYKKSILKILKGKLKMPVDQNVSLVKREFDEMWNNHNLDLADELFSPEFKRYDPGTAGLPDGLQGVKALMAAYLAAFPDLYFMIEDIFGAADKVALRWTAYGTHIGELMGIAPTGKQIVINGIDLSRIKDGKIVEIWTSWDNLGLMRQLGILTA
jgi:steroid delta-isomerase-like uncharacterized protein